MPAALLHFALCFPEEKALRAPPAVAQVGGLRAVRAARRCCRTLSLAARPERIWRSTTGSTPRSPRRRAGLGGVAGAHLRDLAERARAPAGEGRRWPASSSRRSCRASASSRSSCCGADVPMNLLAPFYIVYPLSIGYAIARHDLFAVDRYLRTGVVYAALVAARLRRLRRRGARAASAWSAAAAVCRERGAALSAAGAAAARSAALADPARRRPAVLPSGVQLSRHGRGDQPRAGLGARHRAHRERRARHAHRRDGDRVGRADRVRPVRATSARVYARPERAERASRRSRCCRHATLGGARRGGAAGREQPLRRRARRRQRRRDARRRLFERSARRCLAAALRGAAGRPARCSARSARAPSTPTRTCDLIQTLVNQCGARARQRARLRDHPRTQAGAGRGRAPRRRRRALRRRGARHPQSAGGDPRRGAGRARGAARTSPTVRENLDDIIAEADRLENARAQPARPRPAVRSRLSSAAT